jgi:drug/metabolite transporter (DMT)-like permease
MSVIVAKPLAKENASRVAARATLMLVATTFLWGLSFPLVKNWQDAAVGCPGGVGVASMTLVAIRMALAIPLICVMRPRRLLAATRGEHFAGLIVGVAFFFGFGLQVLGMAGTTPARSAFITSMAGGWVPVLAFLFLGHRAAFITLCGLAVAVAGAAVLSLQTDSKGDSWLPNWGDMLTLAGSLFFAGQILLLDQLGKRVESSHLTFGVFAVGGILAFLFATGLTVVNGSSMDAWLDWTIAILRKPNIQIDLVLLTIFSTVLAFDWMNTYQPRVSAGRAALIYFLEPLFGSGFSILWGHDKLTAQLIAGGLLILLGNLLVELPVWLRHEPKSATIPS